VDLFAGSCAIGFEALSLGSPRCVFIERDRRCASVIESTARELGIEHRVEVRRQTLHRTATGEHKQTESHHREANGFHGIDRDWFSSLFRSRFILSIPSVPFPGTIVMLCQAQPDLQKTASIRQIRVICTSTTQGKGDIPPRLLEDHSIIKLRLMQTTPIIRAD